MFQRLSTVVAQIQHALTPDPQAPGPQGGPRGTLHAATQGGQQPFTQALHEVNKNLAAHGDNDGLPEWKAAKYVTSSQEVEAGDRSNAGAFAESAVDWARAGHLPGTLLNAAGALASGAVDGLAVKGLDFNRPGRGPRL